MGDSDRLTAYYIWKFYSNCTGHPAFCLRGLFIPIMDSAYIGIEEIYG